MSLVEYRRKRHFGKTPEPGAGRAKRTPSQRLKYVIQKHAARRLHYDLRLELEGVHKSWAVPKGPSLDPSEKRLAVQVEDHPLDYGKFEGRIPEGEYGAGEVIIWDRGTWKPVGDPMQGFREGKLEFELNGEKLNGGWLLLRMRGGSRRSDKPQWLLIKKRDAAARPLREGDILEEQPQSVKSGRRLGDPPGKPTATSKPRVRRAKASPAFSQAVPFVKRELRRGAQQNASRSLNPSALSGGPAVKAFAKSLADDLAARFPDRYVANMSKAARKGRIFVDYLRNDRGATAIASYSTRAKAGAPVATPVSWDELTSELAPDQFQVGNLMGRLASLARDPWHGIDRIKQTLPAID